jgi:superfamily II DNA/RNA helicase
MTFKDLNLHEGILKAIEEIGYTTPTPVQSKVIPLIIAGSDICASAQTGTGKTAAFILPTLNRLMTPSVLGHAGPRVLILVPTRELAMQVAAESTKYSRYLPRMKTVCIYGGAPYPLQNRQLSQPYEILVATPGRLIDHLERGRINFSRLEMLILDEADRMLDMGFIRPVEQISAATPKNRQTLMFSATLGSNVLRLSRNLMHKALEISMTPDHAKHANIEQRLHYVEGINDKHRTLKYLLTNLPIVQAIVFTSTKRQAEQLLQTLSQEGHQAAALHGDMSQRERSRTISQVRDGQIRILVATDVAARGIDVQTISHVINFDLPTNAEDYVHRIGRTGRANAKGLALSFATYKDKQIIKQIEQFTGQKMVFGTIPELESKEPKESKPSSYARTPLAKSMLRPKFKSKHFVSP